MQLIAILRASAIALPFVLLALVVAALSAVLTVPA
jgi:hypothetical protein